MAPAIDIGQIKPFPIPIKKNGANRASGKFGKSLCNNKDNSISIVACQDDYHYWANNGYRPSFGKPLWITESDQNYHHIFFDDNIKNNPDDSIIAVRSRENENEFHNEFHSRENAKFIVHFHGQK